MSSASSTGTFGGGLVRARDGSGGSPGEAETKRKARRQRRSTSSSTTSSSATSSITRSSRHGDGAKVRHITRDGC